MMYALDTNIIIRLLQGNEIVRARRDHAWGRGSKIVVPPIVHFEIMRGFLYTPAPVKEASYAVLRKECPIDPVTARLWERAAVEYAKVRKKGFTVHDADLLIAAYCLEGNYTLVTNNTADFMNIDGLNLVDWTI
ncbi:MAG: PIN domain-containing protein [Defluviitaleaceae bacterium]|nr:PIN domain-containing protein [Defluviitaleaceae bacterium]